MSADRCRSGFATPTETLEGFNSFQNVSNGVANPVTLHYLIYQVYVVTITKILTHAIINVNARQGLALCTNAMHFNGFTVYDKTRLFNFL